MTSTTTVLEPKPIAARDSAAPRRGRASRVVIGTLGVLTGLAGIEHGLGEILQGSVRPEGLVIESWPDAAAMEILQGEPAMTIVPNLLVSGILTVIVALAFAVVAIRFGGHPQLRSALIGLSAVMLLVGGGFGPPLLGVVIGLGAMRPNHQEPGRVSRALGSHWAWFLGVSVVGYVALMPGSVLLSAVADFESVLLTSVLPVIAFGGAVLALVAARARDETSLV